MLHVRATFKLVFVSCPDVFQTCLGFSRTLPNKFWTCSGFIRPLSIFSQMLSGHFRHFLRCVQALPCALNWANLCPNLLGISPRHFLALCQTVSRLVWICFTRVQDFVRPELDLDLYPLVADCFHTVAIPDMVGTFLDLFKTCPVCFHSFSKLDSGLVPDLSQLVQACCWFAFQTLPRLCPYLFQTCLRTCFRLLQSVSGSVLTCSGHVQDVCSPQPIVFKTVSYLFQTCLVQAGVARDDVHNGGGGLEEASQVLFLRKARLGRRCNRFVRRFPTGMWCLLVRGHFGHLHRWSPFCCRGIRALRNARKRLLRDRGCVRLSQETALPMPSRRITCPTA